MAKRRLGRTELEIEPLVLGTNVIGGTCDETRSFEVLDAFVSEGFTAIDTADIYTKGNSETIIGKWMKARGNRDKVLIFTKVGASNKEGKRDLSPGWIAEGVEASLRRLQTDHIDLYQSHQFDTETPQEETLRAYDRLVRAGKVRFIGASNFDASRLGEALAIAAREGLPRYETLQNHYNLYERNDFEGPVQDLCVAEEISGLHYFGLARGFLTGKYRKPEDAGKSPRGPGVVERYLNDKGFALLGALDAVAARTGAAHAEIALAWLNAQPGTGGPIASATSVEQVASLARGARLTLSADDIATLTAAGR